MPAGMAAPSLAGIFYKSPVRKRPRSPRARRPHSCLPCRPAGRGLASGQGGVVFRNGKITP